jgi:S-phase kinase-associated protein 1
LLFKKVIEWADYHKNDLPQIEDDETREKNTAEISVWDQNFMNVDSEMLFKLVLVCVLFLF